jgi:hypothetical protein
MRSAKVLTIKVDVKDTNSSRFVVCVVKIPPQESDGQRKEVDLFSMKHQVKRNYLLKKLGNEKNIIFIRYFVCRNFYLL